MDSLTGRTVLITGAAGAVGRACIERFRAAGARLILSDLSTAGDIAAGADVHFARADVTDRAAVDAAFQSGLARFGRIDAAVLAAGIEGPVGLVEALDEASLDRIFAVNVKGVLFWMQACLRHMQANGAGSVVALSSISGVVGTASMSAYAMSKHAVLGLVRSAALEAGPHGVRVNAVCPGPIESDMMRRIDTALTATDPNRFGGAAAAGRGLPLQRYVTAAEVADMIAFLCSDRAGGCHGGAYMVDGGFTAK